MFKRLAILAGTVALWTAVSVAPVQAQQPPEPAAAQPVVQPTVRARLCERDVDPPASLPPAGSGPVVYLYGPCFDAQEGTSLIDYETYLYNIHLKPSRPSQ